MRAGDFSICLPVGRDGPLGRIAVLFNEMESSVNGLIDGLVWATPK